MRVVLVPAFKVCVSVALLWLLFSRVDATRLWSIARAASLPWLTTALGLYLLMILTSAWRWGLLLDAQRISLPFGRLTSSHYVQWVNLRFAVYSRSGPLLYGPAAGGTIWDGFGGPCESQNDGDPIVLYDHLADRWFMSQFAIPNRFRSFLFAPFYQCIAVSQTPDPTGPYHRYQYEFSKLNDYPKFGVWPDGYYMAINQFASVNLQYAGQGVVAFDRAAMLAGQPANMIYFDLANDLTLGGMLPSDLDGPAPPAGSPNYFAQVDDDGTGYPADRIQLWKFHADWSSPAASTFTGPFVLPVAAFDSNMCDFARGCIPQPGTTVKIDALSDRLMYRLQYRNFGTHDALVVNHTVDTDGADHAGVRWYEIRDPGGTPVIHQQGTFAPDALHRWMGSAAMDAAGNLAVAFNASGPAMAPSIRYAARLASDPPGMLGQGDRSDHRHWIANAPPADGATTACWAWTRSTGAPSGRPASTTRLRRRPDGRRALARSSCRDVAPRCRRRTHLKT
ncbi:MAG: flippase-like domain-containing protein [Acidobacteria bacterium]|nr:flippase-like domain-containing protein [Acidobacteriota bacterium]